MKREELPQHVRDALGHLYQEPLLQIHPLAELLAPGAPTSARGPALKRLLLDALQQLRPLHTETYHSPPWRRYRSLVRHYLEGKSLEEIAEEQGISSRQARRDHHEAIGALAEIVWAQYRGLWDESGPPTAAAEPGRSAPVATGDSALDADLRLLVSTETADEGPTRLEGVVERVLDLVGGLAEQVGTGLELKLPKALPPLAASEGPIRQALLSLMSYAVEYCPGGRIAVSAEAVPHGVHLDVVAGGWQGPPPTSLDESERLAMCRRLLELQGDGLELMRAGGRAIAFRLSLLARDAPTVLVVDDNPDVVRLFQRFVEPAGYRLVQATSAQSALRLIAEAPPEIITLDLMMPSHDGWELLQAIRRDPRTRGIPIVVCSVLHERALAMALGASSFLPKPVTQEALLATLEQCRPARPPGSRGSTSGSE